MKFQTFRTLAFVAMACGTGVAASAAPTVVSIDFTSLRCIQEYVDGPNAKDQTFALVDGIAKGKELQARYPEAGKTWTASKKVVPLSSPNAISLWSGSLNDGEFAVVAVSIFQGAGADGTLLKKYEESIIAAEKKCPVYEKNILTLAEFKSLTIDVTPKDIKLGDLVKNERAVIEKIKDRFSRDKNTDHYGGLFNVVVWNDGAKIRKRVLPVGLTYGEHYGKDEVKIYTKLKLTRDNVFMKDKNGEWSDNNQFLPLSEDERTVQVKMLETEELKSPEGYPMHKTTDYLAGVTVSVNGETLKWRLDGQINGSGANDDDIHRFWEVAE